MIIESGLDLNADKYTIGVDSYYIIPYHTIDIIRIFTPNYDTQFIQYPLNPQYPQTHPHPDSPAFASCLPE